MATKTLLACFGHPDDESFGMGGTLALYAARGYRVQLICATRGEAGEINDQTLATQENLGEVRENELRCAARVMGIEPPIFLGYRDSGMMGTADNAHPQAFLRADRNEAIGRVTRYIRELKPDVVVTFEPNGGYGHPDHITIHHVTVSAILAAANPIWYPEQLADGLAPHQVKKLYYTALPRRFFTAIADKLAAAGINLDDIHGVRESNIREWGWPDELVTTAIDVSSTVDKKSEAFWCHRTQLNPNGPFAKLLRLGGDIWREPMSTEYYARVLPAVVPGEPVETDLFAGLD